MFRGICKQKPSRVYFPSANLIVQNTSRSKDGSIPEPQSLFRNRCVALSKSVSLSGLQLPLLQLEELQPLSLGTRPKQTTPNGDGR